MNYNYGKSVFMFDFNSALNIFIAVCLGQIINSYHGIYSPHEAVEFVSLALMISFVCLEIAFFSVIRAK